MHVNVLNECQMLSDLKLKQKHMSAEVRLSYKTVHSIFSSSFKTLALANCCVITVSTNCLILHKGDGSRSISESTPILLIVFG